MKPRPRMAENRVAEIMTNLMSDGYTKIERIPVIGRTGPDLSINEVGLIIDVKSRLEIPAYIFEGDNFTFNFMYRVVTLKNFPMIFSPTRMHHAVKTSSLVDGYYNHIAEWRDQNDPAGIPAIVLHRPKMPYGDAVFVVSISDAEELALRWTTKSRYTSQAKISPFHRLSLT